MTLIVEVPTPKGIVVAADTEETCPSYDAQGNFYELRKSVQKIDSETVGNFQIAIAGAGHAGLIDSFIVRAKRAVAAATSEYSADALRKLLESTLEQFQRNDVALCQDAEKSFKLFILYFCTTTKEYGAWVSEQIVLRDVATDRPELIGWEHELYVGTASRFFRPDMSLAQAILAALYTLKIGDETSKYIREPFHVVVARENGIWMERADYISSKTERLRAFEQQVNDIFLACADSSIHAFRLEEMIKDFSQTAVALHKRHIDEHVGRMKIEDLFTANDAVPGLPPGSIIELNVMRGLEFIHDAERIDAKTVEFRSRIYEAKELFGRQQNEKDDSKPSTSDTSKGQP